MSAYRRERAWQAGKKAGLAGKPESTNNRQVGTIFYDDWLDGYWEGKREGPLPQAVCDAMREAAEWKEQHENLLSVRQQDIAALQDKIDKLEAQLAFKNEAIGLTRGCPGKIVVHDGFYRIQCYKSKHKRVRWMSRPPDTYNHVRRACEAAWQTNTTSTINRAQQQLALD